MSSAGNTRPVVKIVGGFYTEVCRFPAFSGQYGSGGRAAAAIPKEGIDVEFFTYADERNMGQLRALAEATKFTAIPSSTEALFKFEYVHPLSEPLFFSPRGRPSEPLKVTGDIVLCFGMMEGQPVVHATTAIFDPQSHRDAKLFSSNGSTAEKLAIISNDSEVKVLTNEVDELRAAAKLLEIERACVVIVKCGPKGAFVVTKNASERIQAYQTPRVFKIGSGDVFSSMFTYAWAVVGMDPVAAAKVASLATAYYCNTQHLPIPWPLPERFSPSPVPLPTRIKKAYLAGPFFSPEELWMIDECKRLLTAFGVDVFSPFHAVGSGSPEVVATADLKALDDCDFVFAVIDGFDPGTLFEIGYAVGHNIPVIAIYHGDDRCNLTMLLGTRCKVYSDVCSAVYAALSV